MGALVARGGGESAGRTVFSCSHVDVVSSSKRFCARGVHAEGVLGGNNTLKYGWMTGPRFLPVSKA